MAGESDAEQEGHGAHGADGRVEHRPAVPERRGDGPRGGEEGAGWGGAAGRLRGGAPVGGNCAPLIFCAFGPWVGTGHRAPSTLVCQRQDIIPTKNELNKTSSGELTC